MPMDAARARACLDALHALGAMANATTPIRLRIMTTVGSVSSNGTEAANGGGYTGGASAPSITMGAGTGSNPSTSTSSTAVTITNYPRSETINGIELWDSAGSPVRQELGSLTTPRSPAAGDTLSFASGAVVSSLT